MLAAGPELDFSSNYGHMLSTIFVCLMFSTGMPVLYLLCAAYFALYYFTEKYFFIHMYRNPNQFNASAGGTIRCSACNALNLICTCAQASE